jgi:CRISPR-associated endonuclease/helicase Cas3
MSKPKTKQRFNFGRLFFPGEPSVVPYEIRLQPLGDHVGNVRRLVKQWKEFPEVEGSRDRVLKSADIHDMGKPQRFSIQVQTTPKGTFKQYIYSFRGHRFLAESQDLWAQTLARGHHDFSVKDICRDTYNLRKDNPEYAKLLSQNPLTYAHELYILEMCDQIEAELACRVIGDEHQAESRTFMDFTVTRIDNSNYSLDPWPFEQESLPLTFKYWRKRLESSEIAQLEVLHDKESDSKLGNTLDKIVKEWWHSLVQNPEVESRKILLKPLSQEIPANHDVKSIYQCLAGFEPNPMQADMYKAIAEAEHPAVMLKGPTGAGKTESVLFPALAKGYRLILPLPAKSLLEDQKQRVEKYLIKFSKLPENRDREMSLVVDTGSQMKRWVYKNGEDISKNLTINLRRHLYKGDVILTTLDKFLYRYFSFGDKQKSFVFPLRINQIKTLICFDEAHSYDKIAFTNFRSLVQALYEAGRSIVLMTATMPPEQAAHFDYLEIIDYIANEQNVTNLLQFQQRTLKQEYLGQRSFIWLDKIARNSEFPENFQDEVAKIILQEWSAKSNRRILVVVETVKDAAAIYQRLKKSLEITKHSNNRFLFLYHGRIANQSRMPLYQLIQQCDEQKKPYILVTTSAIEVGCDLNAEILISQICPPENLIQRTGRCNRRGDVEDAKVIVVGDVIPEFANTLNGEGWQKYQETLKSMTSFDSQAIVGCITKSQQIDDYRVVELFSMLHDYVYSADLTCQPIHEKGLVVTRSWTPSATLIYDDGTHGDDFSKMPQISVPLDRLIWKKDKETGEITNQYSATNAYERFYHQEQTRWCTRDLRHGSAYQKDIIIKLGPYGHEIEVGLTYEYDEELGFVDLPGIFTKWRPVGFDEKLHCSHSDKNFAVITYTKSLSSTVLQDVK